MLKFGLKLDVKVLEKSWHMSMGTWHDFGSFFRRSPLEISWHNGKASWHD